MVFSSGPQDIESTHYTVIMLLTVNMPQLLVVAPENDEYEIDNLSPVKKEAVSRAVVAAEQRTVTATAATDDSARSSSCGCSRGSSSSSSRGRSSGSSSNFFSKSKRSRST